MKQLRIGIRLDRDEIDRRYNSCTTYAMIDGVLNSVINHRPEFRKKDVEWARAQAKIIKHVIRGYVRKSEATMPVAIPDFLPRDMAKQAIYDWPPTTDSSWHRYDQPHQRKRVLNNRLTFNLRPPLSEMIWHVQNVDAIQQVENASGVCGLVPDLSLWGAGLSQMGPGDVLGLHRDLVRHPNGALERRVNLCVFLCDAPMDGGGSLIIHCDGSQWEFRPTINTAVIFDPSDRHEVTRITGDWQRRAVQVFYYTPPRSLDEWQTIRRMAEFL